MSTIGNANVSVAVPRGAARPRAGFPWLWVGSAVFVVASLGVLAFSPADWVRNLIWRPAGLLSAHIVQPTDLSITLTEDGELKPQKSIELKNEVEGQSTILTVVAESTRVKKGDLLVELASAEMVERLETESIELRRLEADVKAAQEDLDIQNNQNATDIRKAEIDLEVADLELQKYLKGDYPKELKSIEIDISKTQTDILRKQDELKKNRELLEKEFVSKSKVEELEYELKNLEETLRKNELALEILNQYDRVKSTKQKTSEAERARDELERVKKRAESKKAQAIVKLEQAKSQHGVRLSRVTRMKDQLAKTKIFAPADGMVQYPSDGGMGWRGNDEGGITAGAKVFEGQTLVVLPDTAQMIVSFRIHEGDRHKVREGMPCLVRVPAVPNRTFTGKINKIARFADSENRWLNPELKEHKAEILLDETDAPVSPGDTAEIRILIEDATNVLAVPVQSVFTRGNQSFVFVRSGGSGDPRSVKLGRSNTNLVEVVEGIKPGDEVLTSSAPELLAKLPQVDSAEMSHEDKALKAEQMAKRPVGPPGAARGERKPRGEGKGPKPGAARESEVVVKPDDADTAKTETPATVADVSAASQPVKGDRR
jgi:HlyD family secretion protein